MARALAHHVRKDMALLGACELLLSVFLFYGLIFSASAAPQFLAAMLTPSWHEIYMTVAMAVPIVGIAATMGLYRPQICRDPKQLLVTATIAGMLASPIVLSVRGTALTAVDGDPMIWLSKVLGLWLLVVLMSRVAFGFIQRRGRVRRRLLVIGGADRARRLRDLLHRHHGPLFDLMVAEPSQLAFAQQTMRDEPVWGVIVADGTLPAGVAGMLLPGIRVFTDVSFQERHLGRIDLATSGAAGLLDRQWGRTSDSFETVKRFCDAMGSGVLLIATLPLMAVAAILIKLDSPGPVLYRQQRTGLFGRSFMLLKFRSMYVDAEASGTPRWAEKHDRRITRVGRFIRQTRIDELPQLLNVLRGDMSVVGPRPERPHFVAELALALPFYDKRACVKPGITGWAQVNYPYGASVEDAREKLAYDLYYVEHRSILLDFVILCSTVRVILFREGAR